VVAEAPPREFMTCAVTDFQIEHNGRRLALAHAVGGVILLALGGVMALLVALHRVEAIQFLSEDWWYRLVAAHGATMLLFWLLFFEVAALHWGSTMLLNAPMRVPKVAWGAFGAMVLGVLLAAGMMLAGEATVMFTAYPPMEANPLFYLGVILVAVGVLVAVIIFFANVVAAKRDGYHTGSLPLVVFGLATTAIIAVYSLATGAVAYVSLFLWSIGLVESVDPAFYRLFFWGIGHGAQQVNLAAMVAVWYALVGFTVGGRTISEGLSRVAFLLLLAFIHLGAVHHLLVDPGLGTSHRLMNTSYLLYLAVLASLIHAFCIPSAVEIAQRERHGFSAGLFEWLRRAPWKEPGFSALVLSLVFFGFIGGVTGVIMSTMQMNMLVHNTLFVPGHFHGTVVAGTTLAFMGIAYYLLPLLARRQLVGVSVARWQPYVFFSGVAMFSLGMIRAGFYGVPRRSADLSYQATPLPTDLFLEPGVQLSMTAVVVGAVIAVVGGAMFIFVMVATLLSGKVGDRPDAGLVLAFGAQARERGLPERAPVAADGHTGLGVAHEPHERKPGWRNFEAPGTVVLALAFLAYFVVMYILAHFNIARMWPVS
jgi:cytochrome c oxidase subunit I